VNPAASFSQGVDRELHDLPPRIQVGDERPRCGIGRLVAELQNQYGAVARVDRGACRSSYLMCAMIPPSTRRPEVTSSGEVKGEFA